MAARRTLRGIDVSNYQPGDLAALVRRWAVEAVVVKLPIPAEDPGGDKAAKAIEQSRTARTLGCAVGHYVWGYRDESAADSIDAAVQLAELCGGRPHVLAIDCEEYRYVSGAMDYGPDAAWFGAAGVRAAARGQRLAIYTREQWIDEIFPDGREAFEAVAGSWARWLARYDRDPVLPAGLAGKQYSSTAPDGSSLDFNTFDAALMFGLDAGAAQTSADTDELNQFVSANYDTWAEYVAIDGAACSAASLAAMLNHYGYAENISDGLRRIRATGDDVTPALGLLNRLGQGEAIAAALDTAGIASSTHQWADVTRADVVAVLGSGRPIVAQMKNYLRVPSPHGPLGHFLVVDGLLADGSGVLVADSNAGSGKRYSYGWPTFWAEQAGGVCIWPDTAPVVVVPPGGTDPGGEDLGKIAELEAQLADVRAKQEGHLTAIAYLADTLGDRAVALVSRPVIDAETLRAAAELHDEAQRVRAQFVGPRPVSGHT